MAENELPTDYNLCKGREITPTGYSMRKQKNKVQNNQTRIFYFYSLHILNMEEKSFKRQGRLFFRQSFANLLGKMDRKI